MITTIGAGKSPMALALSPDGSRLYVANTDGGTVSAVDTTANNVVAIAIGVAPNPLGLAVSPDGSHLYVACLEGIAVARCTVERLMAELGLTSATRGKARRTTIADPCAARPADLVQRQFGPPAPNRLWVADLTYVSTWSGFAYVAFVVDAYARRILGWRAASAMVLDAIEQAIWTRQQEGVLDLKDVVHHTDRRSHYTSIRFSERLAEAGIQPSVGAVGSSYDNALAETINGLYKTELIKPRKPWQTIDEVELATAEWVDWFNHRRLYEYCGDIPPVELETAYYAQTRTSRRLSSHTRKSPDSPGRFRAER
jgi:putative transposase